MESPGGDRFADRQCRGAQPLCRDPRSGNLGRSWWNQNPEQAGCVIDLQARRLVNISQIARQFSHHARVDSERVQIEDVCKWKLRIGFNSPRASCSGRKSGVADL